MCFPWEGWGWVELQEQAEHGHVKWESGQQAQEAMFWWPSHLGDVSGSGFAGMNQNLPQCLLLRDALF